ncbi:MAG: LysM peptidoglycan-binding domain-containing protein [Anaerolineae bacterium]|nr:LysM peptidoglycan-binding domain-containing protein [Anaerolineae bacterium]
MRYGIRGVAIRLPLIGLLILLAGCGGNDESDKRQVSSPSPIASPQIVGTETPTPTIDPNITPSPTPCVLSTEWTETYTVRADDTLGAIAIAAGTTIKAVQDANCLTDRDLLQVGQVLLVPNAFSIDIAASETGIESLIVFVRDGGFGQRNLWAVKSDGTALRPLTESGYVVGRPVRDASLVTVALRVVSPFHVPESVPKSLDSLPNDIWIVNADGTNLHRLVDQGPADALYRSDAVWSLDGSQVFFTEQGGLFGSLVRINEDGTQRYVLTTGDFVPPDGFNPIPPALSPDGRMLAYVTWDDVRVASLQTINTEDLSVQAYASNFEYWGGPYWVPLDGDNGPPAIAFAIADPNGTTLWHVIDPQTGQLAPRPNGLVLVNEGLDWTIRPVGDGLALFQTDTPQNRSLPSAWESVSWGPAGARLVAAHEDGLMLFDFETGYEIRITEGHDLTPVWMPPGWWVLP